MQHPCKTLLGNLKNPCRNPFWILITDTPQYPILQVWGPEEYVFESTRPFLRVPHYTSSILHLGSRFPRVCEPGLRTTVITFMKENRALQQDLLRLPSSIDSQSRLVGSFCFGLRWGAKTSRVRRLGQESCGNDERPKPKPPGLYQNYKKNARKKCPKPSTKSTTFCTDYDYHLLPCKRVS